MIRWSEHEADARLFETCSQCWWIQVYPDPEVLQHVGSTNVSADSTVAMFRDAYPGRRGDDRSTGGDIEGTGSIPARTSRIQHRSPVKVQRARPFAHRTAAAGQLRRGFSFHLDCDQK